MDVRGEEVNLPTLPQRGTCSVSHLWHVQLEECFSTNLSDTELRTPQLTPSPSSREQDTGRGQILGPAWARRDWGSPWDLSHSASSSAHTCTALSVSRTQ